MNTSLSCNKICKIGGILSITGIVLLPVLIIISVSLWYDGVPYKFLEYLIVFMPKVVLITGLLLMCSYQQKSFRAFLILSIASILFTSILPYVQKEVVCKIVPYVLATNIYDEVIGPINPLSGTYLAIFSFIWLGLRLLLYVSSLGASIVLALKIQKEKNFLNIFHIILSLSVAAMVAVRIFSIVYIFSLPKNSSLWAVTLNALRLGYDVSISNLRLFEPPFEFIIMHINIISLSIFTVLIIASIVLNILRQDNNKGGAKCF